MSIAARQRITGSVCAFGAAAAAYCISRMIPYGLAGNAGKVKQWFILAIIAIAVSLPCGVAYYYYRSRTKEAVDLERTRVEVDILSRAAQRPAAEPPQSNPAANETKNNN